MWPLYLQLTGLTLLTICLILLRRQRKQDRTREEEWTGTPMDTRPLLGRLQQLRQDYLQLLRSQPHAKAEQRSRLYAARRAIRGRSYFEDSPPQVVPGTSPEPATNAETQGSKSAAGEGFFCCLRDAHCSPTENEIVQIPLRLRVSAALR